MLLFLSRGAKGIGELEEKTRKYGLSCRGGKQEDVKAQTKAQRELGMAMEGTKLQFWCRDGAGDDETEHVAGEPATEADEGPDTGVHSARLAANTMVGELDSRMPAIEAGATKLGAKIGDVAKAFQSNWPRFAPRLRTSRRIGAGGAVRANPVGAFKSLPPEVQTALATPCCRRPGR